MVNMKQEVDTQNQFYKHGTNFIEHIFGSFIHVFRLTPGETMTSAVNRHEHYLASWLRVQPGQRILDVGCGNGGPTREIARFLDVRAVGVDLEEHHIRSANKLAAAAKQQDQVSFVTADFLNMKFDEASFDGAYAIEATAYAPDLKIVYGEIFKLLEPGARFAVYEAVLSNKYQDDDSSHRAIRQRYESLIEAPPLRKASTAVEAMKAAGFELEVAEDLAERPGSIPWYYPIDGKYGSMACFSDTFAKNYYSFIVNSFRSRGIVYKMTGLLEALKLVPSGTREGAAQAMESFDALYKAGENGIVTPMFLMVGKKPERKI